MTLFKNIRRTIFNNAQTSKYLKYAIGEIILVVIGILIALQINNWNEDRKTDVRITTLMTALRNDLLQDKALINQYLPEINNQILWNESLRNRIAKPSAKIDTLIKIARHEFNPNWTIPVLYNNNAFKSLNETGLIEILPDSIKAAIKDFYVTKNNKKELIDKISIDYSNKVSSYVDTYTFGSTALHDQGPLIDSLVWDSIDLGDLAAKFQGISNFKRILYDLTKDEMEFSLNNSKTLLFTISQYLKVK